MKIFGLWCFGQTKCHLGKLTAVTDIFHKWISLSLLQSQHFTLDFTLLPIGLVSQVET